MEKYTTFPNETFILKRGKEVLVETDKPSDGRRQYVAIDKQGRTDYPLVYSSQTNVAYDHPEWFTKAFKAMVRATLLKA